MKNFSPLIFLAALGAGGLSVASFAFLQYTTAHGAGLTDFSQITMNPLNWFLVVMMIGFGLLHFLLTFWFLPALIKWRFSAAGRQLLSDPFQNSTALAPVISLAMTLNVFIGSVRFFIPAFYENFQQLMWPGFAAWMVIWLWVLVLEARLLAQSFVKKIDMRKFGFGWLLHPFALGMVSVAGAGLAALAKNPEIAFSAAFMSFVSGGMGIFLLLLGTVLAWRTQLARDGLPEQKFLPSFLIIIPNITLYAITAFRWGHFFERQLQLHLDWFFPVVMTISFALEFGYFIFGFTVLFKYFRQDFFQKYDVTQWGLICPLVAFAVLGSFVHKVFYPSALLYWTIILTMVMTGALFIFLLIQHQRRDANL